MSDHTIRDLARRCAHDPSLLDHLHHLFDQLQLPPQRRLEHLQAHQLLTPTHLALAAALLHQQPTTPWHTEHHGEKASTRVQLLGPETGYAHVTGVLGHTSASAFARGLGDLQDLGARRVLVVVHPGAVKLNDAVLDALHDAGHACAGDLAIHTPQGWSDDVVHTLFPDAPFHVLGDPAASAQQILRGGALDQLWATHLRG